MKRSAESYLNEKEKVVIEKLKEDYKSTGDIKSYQSAQELLSIAETRRHINKLKREVL